MHQNVKKINCKKENVNNFNAVLCLSIKKYANNIVYIMNIKCRWVYIKN